MGNVVRAATLKGGSAHLYGNCTSKLWITVELISVGCPTSHSFGGAGKETRHSSGAQPTDSIRAVFLPPKETKEVLRIACTRQSDISDYQTGIGSISVISTRRSAGRAPRNYAACSGTTGLGKTRASRWEARNIVGHWDLRQLWNFSRTRKRERTAGPQSAVGYCIIGAHGGLGARPAFAGRAWRVSVWHCHPGYCSAHGFIHQASRGSLGSPRNFPPNMKRETVGVSEVTSLSQRGTQSAAGGRVLRPHGAGGAAGRAFFKKPHTDISDGSVRKRRRGSLLTSDS